MLFGVGHCGIDQSLPCEAPEAHPGKGQTSPARQAPTALAGTAAVTVERECQISAWPHTKGRASVYPFTTAASMAPLRFFSKAAVSISP